MAGDPHPSELTDADRLGFLLGVYFRTQAAIEKWMGPENLPDWTEHLAEINASATNRRMPDPVDRARSVVTSLATMLDVYGSDATLGEDGNFRLDVHRCGIWDYRERAQEQGVELTLSSPCEFCVDLRYRTAARLGVTVSHELGHRSCRWVSRVPEQGAAGTTDTPTAPLPYRREAGCPFDPAQELRDLCAGRPVPKVPLTSGKDVWLITRYDDARSVLGDARFSSGLTPVGTALPRPEDRTLKDELSDRQPGTFLEYDPPEHTRLRRIVSAEFSTKRMRQLRPRIEAITIECLDATAAAGPPVDLVQTFALPMPSRVICELLGVPYATAEFDFPALTRVMTDMMAAPDALLEARDAMRGYMRRLVSDFRHNPPDTLLGRLIREHGHDLSNEELVGVGDLLLIAGHETTAQMLGLGTLALLQHPDQLAMVRDDPAKLNNAVEELVRYVSIANHGAVRTATEDVTVGGQPIKAGEQVVVSLPLANRDETRYDDPDGFDITRDPKGGLGFGYGIHHCIAARMARMEMRIAFPALLRRFPTLRLAAALEEIPFRTSNVTYGVDSLPVAW